MFGTEVNPFTVLPGDKLASKHRPYASDPITGEMIFTIVKSHEVKRVDKCSVPEKIHIDGDCYDGRFTTVVIAK